jgi:hypothetical protein
MQRHQIDIRNSILLVLVKSSTSKVAQSKERYRSLPTDERDNYLAT